MWIDLDLEVDLSLSFERAHELVTDFETKLRSELMDAEGSTAIADINAHIEPRAVEPAHGTPLDPISANAYVQRISSIALELKGSSGTHHIELHEIGGRIYLSFHLLIYADISIAEVHEIAEEMETRLRNEFPALGRIVIHTEPC